MLDSKVVMSALKCRIILGKWGGTLRDGSV